MYHYCQQWTRKIRINTPYGDSGLYWRLYTNMFMCNTLSLQTDPLFFNFLYTLLWLFNWKNNDGTNVKEQWLHNIKNNQSISCMETDIHKFNVAVHFNIHFSLISHTLMTSHSSDFLTLNMGISSLNLAVTIISFWTNANRCHLIQKSNQTEAYLLCCRGQYNCSHMYTLH